MVSFQSFALFRLCGKSDGGLSRSIFLLLTLKIYVSPNRLLCLLGGSALFSLPYGQQKESRPGCSLDRIT